MYLRSPTGGFAKGIPKKAVTVSLNAACTVTPSTNPFWVCTINGGLVVISSLGKFINHMDTIFNAYLFFIDFYLRIFIPLFDHNLPMICPFFDNYLTIIWSCFELCMAMKWLWFGYYFTITCPLFYHDLAVILPWFVHYFTMICLLFCHELAIFWLFLSPLPSVQWFMNNPFFDHF